MSTEESYLAILRYLTNEREPYAPGTEGNVKRKIRKAAACYVVRSGTLYYQRRHRDKERFTELEVVLQSERRKGLLEKAHIGAGGEHLTRHQTWHLLSQRYWWRGILKEMKDYIKKCSKCQEKADRSRSSNDPSEMLEEFGLEVCLDGNETDEELGNFASGANADPKPSRKKPVAKHELVFVDSKGIVKQSSLKHGQAVLNQLNQQRLANQFCDVTLFIEGEEHKAHKSVLAASSEYFRELFIEKGAVSSHEAFVDLSGFCKASFLPLLEFVYTSELRFDFCSMADLVMLARHLFMHDVLEICELVHKQMEEKQLTLYQKGDVQTVASEADVQVVHMEETGIVGTPKLSVVKEVASGQQIITLENVKCQTAEDVIASTASPPNTISTTLSVEATLQLTNERGIPVGSVDGAQFGSVDGATAIFISNSTSDQQPTVLIPTVIDVSSVEPQQTLQIIQEVITSAVQLSAEPSETLTNIQGPESQEMPVHESVVEEQADLTRNALSSEDTPPLAAEGSPCVDEAMDVDVNEDKEHQAKTKESLKRKRGKLPTSPKSAAVEGSTSQPTIPDVVDKASSEGTADDGAKASNVGDQSSGTDSPPSESPGSSEMDPYKSKLRERSVGEGGYIQLHRGKEKKNFNRKSIPKSAVQQAARKLVQRGKKRMLPPKKEVPKVEEEHKCKECGMVFQRKYALIMHGMKHDCVKEFKCPLCQKEFQYRASLRTHLIRHSRKTEPAAEETEAIKGRTKRQYICDICGRTLPKMCSLRLHMLKHTGVKPHACQICQKTFTHKHGLKMHQALHDSQKQFKCDLCDKSFVTNRSLQEHVSTHTGETKYLCTVCGKTFHRASGLSKHLKKHRPKPEVREYHCTQCERSFSEARDLQQHMNKHLGVKPFECEVCGKCYSWKKDWYSHVKSHSVTEPYRCNICGKEFFEKSLFRRHVNKATHGKKGRIKRNIERVCNHCGKAFTQLREFRRHVNNHEGVKPFECLTCGVAWADARSLKRHVRTHTGERPYVCPECNEAYIDARNLRKHMTKYHSYIPCKIMLEKDSLQFHHQGTQVEHAVSFMPNEAGESHSGAVAEEIETVLVTGDVLETVEDVSSTQNSDVTSLSDQNIMQVVNYVLAQQQGVNLPEETDHIETVEVEVSEVL
ncbi:zinc finger and BTB domain-containing protein 11 [Bufo gargarizans]|uniref:zinc finger and BTB domain-containing protein 11 n=1 Tax=Bufo gargarizans TaxID=30331 RepID=UPI001CF50E13|nr:zinc finger and BTB domain-containing protein 11 [Bufo gargarizans]